jgi:diacylglycerol kinase
MLNFRRLIKSIIYAKRGVVYAWRHEQNFRVHSAVGLLVILGGLVVGLSNFHFIMILMLVTIVLVLELFNTFCEKLIDIVHPRVHEYVAILKDLLAAAVFVASIGAIVVGGLIFWPYLWG